MSETGSNAEWVFPHQYGQYQLLERIGAGGMAEVFRARRGGIAGFEKIVVIKRILPHLAQQDRFVKMFVNEAKLAAQIQHQNVVQVFELGQIEEGSELFIVMEHVSGVDFRKLLMKSEETQLFIPTWFALHAVRETLNALAHAHNFKDEESRPVSVVHRDVTPANVFISYQGEVKLADFGIAKAVGESPDTEAGQVKGNVGYMSPEALLGDPLDARTDIFSAGVVLWEGLTQQRLFQGRSNFETARMICDSERPPPSRFNPEVSPELDAITLRAIEVQREQRFESAAEFLTQVVDILARVKPKLLKSEVSEVVEVLMGLRPATPEFTQRGPRPVPAPKYDYALPAGLLPSASQLPPHASSMPTVAGIPVPGTAASVPQAPAVWAPSGQVASQVAAHPQRDPIVEYLGQGTITFEPQPSVSGSFVRDGQLVFDDPGEDVNAPLELASETRSENGRFIIREEGGSVSGPYSYQDLANLRGRKVTDISLDRQNWTDIRTFALLSGIDRLSPNPFPLRKVTLAGKLHERSLCSVLAQLGREGATGRLLVMESGHGEVARREIYLLRGAPTFVYSDHPTLQLPTLLAKHEVVRADQLDELMAHVLQRRTPLLDLISWSAFTDINRYWPLMMRDRLVEVFRWGAGRFAFDANAEQHRATPFARSIFQVLPDAVHRSFNMEELSTLLGPVMNAKLKRSEAFPGLLRQLSLSEKQKELAGRLGQRKSLSQLIEKAPSVAQAQLVMAYLLREVGALVADD